MTILENGHTVMENDGTGNDGYGKITAPYAAKNRQRFRVRNEKWRQGYQIHQYIYGDQSFIGDRAQGYFQW